MHIYIFIRYEMGRVARSKTRRAKKIHTKLNWTPGNVYWYELVCVWVYERVYNRFCPRILCATAWQLFLQCAKIHTFLLITWTEFLVASFLHHIIIIYTAWLPLLLLLLLFSFLFSLLLLQNMPNIVVCRWCLNMRRCTMASRPPVADLDNNIREKRKKTEWKWIIIERVKRCMTEQCTIVVCSINQFFDQLSFTVIAIVIVVAAIIAVVVVVYISQF